MCNINSKPGGIVSIALETWTNCQREAFCHGQKAESTTIRELTTLPLTPTWPGGEGVPLSIVHSIDAFGVSVSAPRFVAPRTKSWQRH